MLWTGLEQQGMPPNEAHRALVEQDALDNRTSEHAHEQHDELVEAMNEYTPENIIVDWYEDALIVYRVDEHGEPIEE